MRLDEIRKVIDEGAELVLHIELMLVELLAVHPIQWSEFVGQGKIVTGMLNGTRWWRDEFFS